MSEQNSKSGKGLLRISGAPGIILLLIIGCVLGYMLRGPGLPEPSSPGESADAGPTATEEMRQIWTCSMHPQIRQPKPGKCPICAMDLVPVSTGGAEMSGPRQFVTSEAAKELMKIQTSPVERRFVTSEVRMVGKVDVDETKLAYITAWVPGRIDRMYVDYTGITVRKGDHLVDLYSPNLLAAQDELRRAVKAVDSLRPDAPPVVGDTAKSTLDAVRNKLRLWGLTPSQITEAEQSGRFSDHITIYAPVGGTVIHRNGQEGMYVDTGTRIYTLADLNEVWVKLDAYESDLMWLRYGQTVEFTTEAYPGERFEGRIAFIDPVLDTRSRTVKVRVNVPNPEGKLKPEMFVRAVVRTQVAEGGRVMDPALAGKWIGPMHPEIVKDGPGACDICGMPLVRAEELGYVTATADDSAKPLVIPASAPLITGQRAIVYVEAPNTDKPTFEGREIALGPRTGDYYIVRSGLQEGEQVVTNGNFKIDSALQIMAKPSMMMPEGGSGVVGHDHGVAHTRPAVTDAGPAIERSFDAPQQFQEQLAALYDAYLGLHAALAGDRFDDSSKAVASTQAALEGVDMGLLDGAAHMQWMTYRDRLAKILQEMRNAEDIGAVRSDLKPFSSTFVSTIKSFGIAPAQPVYQVHCPMAVNGKGANWLQANTDVHNPYFGAAMLSCGNIVGRLDQVSADAAHMGHPPEGSHSEGSSHD